MFPYFRNKFSMTSAKISYSLSASQLAILWRNKLNASSHPFFNWNEAPRGWWQFQVLLESSRLFFHFLILTNALWKTIKVISKWQAEREECAGQQAKALLICYQHKSSYCSREADYSSTWSTWLLISPQKVNMWCWKLAWLLFKC